MPAPRNIFVIDDDSDFVSLLTEILTQAGYTVQSSNQPKAALEAIRNGFYDMVLLDQRMPDLLGVELLGQLRQTYPHLPVIVVSGYLESTSTQQFINLGVAGIFFKPLNIFALLKRVDEVFKGAIKSSGSTATTDHGLRGLTRCPFGGGQTKELFLKKIQTLANFKGNLLLVGDSQSPFESVSDEIIKRALPLDHRVNWRSEYADLGALKIALSDYKSATLVLREIPKLGPAERDTLYQLARRSEATRDLPTLRFIFCLTEELDALYEAKAIDDEFYLFLGGLELKMPKPGGPQMLHREEDLHRAITLIEGDSTTPFKATGRILVLDDEDLHALMVVDILEESGYKTVKLNNPAEALLVLRKERFSLVITDFRMPGINGVDFVAQTRQNDPGLPVLVVTGNIQVPEMVRVGNMGITKLLQKPINPKGFLDEVRALIRG